MTRSDTQRLRDILEFTDRISEHRRAGLPADSERDATLYCLVVIGEAVNALSSDLTQRAPEVPWRQIVDMRNLLAHGYFGVDGEIVEMVLTNRLAVLRDAAERLLQS